jgi:cobalt-zinc-cadmium efflux system membrane fusion protein
MPVVIEPAPDPAVVDPPHPELFQLVEAEARRVHNDLTVNGVVAPDVGRTVPVNSMSGGRVLEIHARLGDEVTKGQLLLRLNSPDLASAIADYQKALADEILARRALDRAQSLFEHGAMAQKELENAEDVEAKAKVDVKTTSDRIRILGGGTDALSSVIDIEAPVSGTIVEQNTTGSAAVKSLDNSPNLFTIADLSRVWLLCDVYENNLAEVRIGDTAEVRLNAYPDRPLRGRVSNIAKLLDPTTRTAKVRLEMDNVAGLMRPGMFATARFVSQGTQMRLILPSTAILRLHDKDWVFRPVPGNRFRRVEIQAGHALDDGTQQILGGLQPGDRVIANALQFSSAVEK